MGSERPARRQASALLRTLRLWNLRARRGRQPPNELISEWKIAVDSARAAKSGEESELIVRLTSLRAAQLEAHLQHGATGDLESGTPAMRDELATLWNDLFLASTGRRRGKSVGPLAIRLAILQARLNPDNDASPLALRSSPLAQAVLGAENTRIPADSLPRFLRQLMRRIDGFNRHQALRLLSPSLSNFLAHLEARRRRLPSLLSGLAAPGAAPLSTGYDPELEFPLAQIPDESARLDGEQPSASTSRLDVIRVALNWVAGEDPWRQREEIQQAQRAARSLEFRGVRIAFVRGREMPVEHYEVSRSISAADFTFPTPAGPTTLERVNLLDRAILLAQRPGFIEALVAPRQTQGVRRISDTQLAERTSDKAPVRAIPLVLASPMVADTAAESLTSPHLRRTADSTSRTERLGGVPDTTPSQSREVQIFALPGLVTTEPMPSIFGDPLQIAPSSNDERGQLTTPTSTEPLIEQGADDGLNLARVPLVFAPTSPIGLREDTPPIGQGVTLANDVARLVSHRVGETGTIPSQPVFRVVQAGHGPESGEASTPRYPASPLGFEPVPALRFDLPSDRPARGRLPFATDVFHSTPTQVGAVRAPLTFPRAEPAPRREKPTPAAVVRVTLDWVNGEDPWKGGDRLAQAKEAADVFEGRGIRLEFVRGRERPLTRYVPALAQRSLDFSLTTSNGPVVLDGVEFLERAMLLSHRPGEMKILLAPSVQSPPAPARAPTLPPFPLPGRVSDHRDDLVDRIDEPTADGRRHTRLDRIDVVIDWIVGQDPWSGGAPRLPTEVARRLSRQGVRLNLVRGHALPVTAFDAGRSWSATDFVVGGSRGPVTFDGVNFLEGAVPLSQRPGQLRVLVAPSVAAPRIPHLKLPLAKAASDEMVAASPDALMGSKQRRRMPREVEMSTIFRPINPSREPRSASQPVAESLAPLRASAGPRVRDPNRQSAAPLRPAASLALTALAPPTLVRQLPDASTPLPDIRISPPLGSRNGELVGTATFATPPQEASAWIPSYPWTSSRSESAGIVETEARPTDLPLNVVIYDVEQVTDVRSALTTFAPTGFPNDLRQAVAAATRASGPIPREMLLGSRGAVPLPAVTARDTVSTYQLPSLTYVRENEQSQIVEPESIARARVDRSPVTAHVMRGSSMATEAVSAPSVQSSTSQSPNIDVLARTVYDEIKRRLALERERSGLRRESRI